MIVVTRVGFLNINGFARGYALVIQYKGLCVIDCTISNCLPQYLERVNSMGLRKSLKKAMVYLLGVVDEYWAMREPSQYGKKDPECSISAESQDCVSKSVPH